MSGGPPDSARVAPCLRIALMVGLVMLSFSILGITGHASAQDGGAGTGSSSSSTTGVTLLPTTTTTTEATTTTVAETTTTYYETTTTYAQSDPVYEAPATTEAQVIESTTSESVTSTTLRNLLIPGDGTDGAESTTTSSTTVVKASDAASSGIDETTRVWLVVGGLAAIAFGIIAWTVYYWRATRPDADPDIDGAVAHSAPGPSSSGPATKPLPSTGPVKAGANAAVRTVLVKNVPPEGR